VHLKKCFHIKILGQELSVSSDSGDEHVANVIEYVNDKVKEIRKLPNEYDALNVAILTALNIADEYIKFKGTEKDIYSQLESRSEKLISLINEIS
jgi:cell division protein ZapA